MSSIPIFVRRERRGCRRLGLIVGRTVGTGWQLQVQVLGDLIIAKFSGLLQPGLKGFKSLSSGQRV